MKKMYIALSVLAMCFASCKKETKVETEVTATDTTKVVTEDAPVAEEPLDSVAEMEAWKTYMTPGDAHKMLASEAGSWNNEMTFWHDADSKPEKATSTAEIKMILGGRYQEANYKGNMMGMPFEGRGTVAYDNSTGEYTSTWIDNMGTGMMVMKGKMGSDGKTLELKGKMVDPARKKETNCREVYTIVDANTRKMEMYCDKNGKDLKNMEIVMKRK